MTDPKCISDELERLFNYQNTDIETFNVVDPDNWHRDIKPEKFDFVMCADVLEHVQAPVQRAFCNLYHILKPGGVLCLTVPYGRQSYTIEHFPKLYDWHIGCQDGKLYLENIQEDGQVALYQDLAFHEPGSLEMRYFSLDKIIEHLKQAGFSDIKIHSQEVPEIGILYPSPICFPITAIKE